MISGEATNTNFIIFGLIRSGLEPTIYRTGGEPANHYATDAVQILENSDSLKDFFKIESRLLHKAVTQILVHKKHNKTIFFFSKSKKCDQCGKTVPFVVISEIPVKSLIQKEINALFEIILTVNL